MHPAIVIVGGGPAGLSAALHLLRQAPELAAQTIVLESEDYPRPKLCGGGITVHGEEQMRLMGVAVDTPAFEVERLVFRLGGRSFSVAHPVAMRVVNRAAFDAGLAETARRRGICVQSGERVLEVAPVPGGMRVVTPRATYTPRVVVGADGANSLVRRKLKLQSPQGVARLLRVLTPVEPAAHPLWQAKTALFDFSCVQAGVQGYSWDFPCYVDGEPRMNRGIFDSRIDPEPAAERRHRGLLRAFEAHLERDTVALAEQHLEGHPVRWFNPEADFARPHALLTGDAAGVDPLFAEGISYAMEYGEVAAAALVDAFERGDFSFATYRRRLVEHRLGTLLARRTAVAKGLYNRRYWGAWQLVWRLAAVAAPPLQRVIGRWMALLP